MKIKFNEMKYHITHHVRHASLLSIDTNKTT